MGATYRSRKVELRLVREPRAKAALPFSGAKSVYDFMKPLVKEHQEHFYVVLTDVKNEPTAIKQIVGASLVSKGTLDASLVHPREVFKVAVVANAAAVILVHNHPSGDPEPSPEDVALTRRLVEAGTLLGIPVLDHVIVGEEGFVSLAERGVV
jgi:DNA repair protein RadC